MGISSSVGSTSTSLLGINLLNIVNEGNFEDQWKTEDDGIYFGQLKSFESGFHKYVVFAGFDVGTVCVDLFLQSKISMQTRNSVGLFEKPLIPGMSFAFDLVYDKLEERTYLRYRSALPLEHVKMALPQSGTFVVFQLSELKRIVNEFYGNFGNYNFFINNCRDFAQRVIEKLLEESKTIDLTPKDFDILVESCVFEVEDAYQLVIDRKLKEKLFIGKCFELIEMRYSKVIRNLSEYTIHRAISGWFKYKNFDEIFLSTIQLGKNTVGEVMLFVTMISGYFKLSFAADLPHWNIRCQNKHLLIKGLCKQPNGSVDVIE